MHFKAPSYPGKHGHMEENLQDNSVTALLYSQKEPQQSGKQQHVSSNSAI